jgi:endonuclease-8
LPEGPEIRRAADELAAAIAGRQVTKLFFAFDHLKPYASRLQGGTVCQVTARGKAILTRFSNGLTLYTHNQLYGRWLITADGEYPDSSRQLRLAIHTGEPAALLYSASDISILSDTELQQHPYISRLGPDLLDPGVDAGQLANRLNEKQYRRRCLMGLLQDQRVMAGMGNYLCCEALHVAGIHPQQRPADLSDTQLQELAGSCMHLIRQSYETGGITNGLERATLLRRQGVSFEACRFHVYRREGLPCYRCGTGIIKGKFCGRMGYLCPTCQRHSRATAEIRRG